MKLEKFEKNKRMDNKYKKAEIDQSNAVKAERKHKVEQVKRQMLIEGIQEYRKYLGEVQTRKEHREASENARNAADLKRKIERIQTD